MSDQRDPRFDQGRPPGRPAAPGGPGRRQVGRPGPPGPGGPAGGPPPGPRPDPRPGPVPGPRHPGLPPGAPRPGPVPPGPVPPAGPVPPDASPQGQWPQTQRRHPGEPVAGVPLLTHEDSGVAVVDRPPDPGDGPPPEHAGGSIMWRRVRRSLYWLLGIALLGPVLAFVAGWVLFGVPSAEETAVAQVATYTFADGTPLATVRPDNVNRVVVTLDRVPEHVREAVLAAEDRSFYSNPGFDLTGIARAAWNQLTGGVGGGSTITQQYVKVVTEQDDFSLWRKYREIVIAVKISREQTKDQILENYLNVIYLGRGAYGMQAASQAYFGKDVEQLTVSEGAMLAGIIQSPSRWDPAKNPDRAAERWNFVLDGMVAQSWISPAERAEQQFPQWLPEAPSAGGIPGDSLGHIYSQAKAELEARGITEQQIDTEGLTITTTVDPGRQEQAVEAARDVLDGQPDNLRSALVSIDPRSGAVQAYYGGENGVGVDYAQALRQPGSSFKPFVLSAALQSGQGIGLGTTYDGSSPQTFNGVEVNNSEGFNCGSCTVKTAMTRSINTVFYRMALDVGPAAVIDAAHQAGIPADLLPEAQGGIALGDQEVHPIDMASAFATFAADGVRHQPYLVSRVTAADGRVLFDRGIPTGEQAVPENVARNVTESMLDVASSSGIGLGGRPVAAKTGTVQHPSLDNQNKDAWTVGYTPQLSTAVWVGTDTSEPIQNASGRPIFGRMLPGSIWRAYMSDALRGAEVERFSRFTPLGEPPVAERDESTGSRRTGTPGTSSSAPSTGSQDAEDSGDGNSGDTDSGDSGDGDSGDGDSGDGDGAGVEPNRNPDLGRPDSSDTGDGTPAGFSPSGPSGGPSSRSRPGSSG
jgi:membrane peptidoglycan carboxypeptidase